MRYPAISANQARDYILKVREGDEPVLESFINIKGSGSDYPLGWVDELHSKLVQVKAKYPSVLSKRDQAGGRFESEACEFVHKAVHNDLEVLADPEFWIYLCVARFADIVEWRHGGDDGTSQLANYGIGNKVENLLYRMWLRAELVYDQSSSDPYDLAKRGDQDLWRSHILRAGYSSVREVAKALIRFQYPTDKKSRLSTDGIRVVAKRLKRVRANIIFEYLSPQRIDSLIIAQSVNLPNPNKKK